MEYKYINSREVKGVGLLVLYSHGMGYAVTTYRETSQGVTLEFEHRSDAVKYRESVRH